MATEQLAGRKVAFLAANGVNETELAQPWQAVENAGGTPQLVSLECGEIQAAAEGEGEGGGAGRAFRVDCTAADVTERDYDALVIPGGARSVDALRTDARAVGLVRGFLAHDKPVAAIGEGPLLFVAADAARGRTVTSDPGCEGQIRAAGADWVDRPVAVDQSLVTSRAPADLGAFCTTLVSALASAIEERSVDKMVEQTFPASDPLPGPSAL